MADVLEKAVLWHDRMKERYRVDVYKLKNEYVSDQDMLEACNFGALGSWQAIAVVEELTIKENIQYLKKVIE